MRTLGTTVLTTGLVTLAAAVSQAAEAKMEGAHLCCEGCVQLVNKALSDVEGVSGVAASVEAGTVTFQAAEEKAAKAGMKALAMAGLHGKATFDGKEIALPDSGFKKGTSERMVIYNVLMCCPKCEKAVTEAIEEVPNVDEVRLDRKRNTVRVIARGGGGGAKKTFETLDVIAALNKAGFHGTRTSGKDQPPERKDKEQASK